MSAILVIHRDELPDPMDVFGKGGGVPQMWRAATRRMNQRGASSSDCGTLKMLRFSVIQLPKRYAPSLQYNKSSENFR